VGGSVPCIARAVHGPGRWGGDQHGTRHLGDELLCGLLRQRLEHPLHDRVLLSSGLAGDGEHRQLFFPASQPFIRVRLPVSSGFVPICVD